LEPFSKESASSENSVSSEGNRIKWDYDIGGRLLRKTYADNTHHNYTYDLAGRPSTITDAKNQIKTRSYFRDGHHPALGDLRLQEIKHQLPGSTPLSSHGYTGQ